MSETDPSRRVLMTWRVSDRAAASWELVVISMASWTLFCRASLVLWSTGSTDWMSTLLITRLFWAKRRLGRTASFSSKPNTAEQMIRFEFWTDKANDS